MGAAIATPLTLTLLAEYRRAFFLASVLTRNPARDPSARSVRP